MPSTSPDSPFIVSSTLTFPNAMGSLCDYIFSGTLERFPTMKHRVLRGPGRLDALRARSGPTSSGRSAATTASARRSRNPPSQYVPGRIYGCIFDDETGLREPRRDRHGADLLRDRLPPRRQHVPALQGDGASDLRQGRPDDEELYKLIRGNAIKAFGLDRSASPSSSPRGSAAGLDRPGRAAALRRVRRRVSGRDGPFGRPRRRAQPRGSPRACRARMFFWICEVPP